MLGLFLVAPIEWGTRLGAALWTLAGGVRQAVKEAQEVWGW